jgi:hypothetical protein
VDSRELASFMASLSEIIRNLETRSVVMDAAEDQQDE